MALCCGTPATNEAIRGKKANEAAGGVRKEKTILASGGEGAPRADGGGDDTFSLLRAAGLEQWRPLAWQSREGERFSLLSMPGVDSHDLVYLSPEAPDVLTELRPSDCCITGSIRTMWRRYSVNRLCARSELQPYD